MAEKYRYSKKLESPEEILRRWLANNKARYGINNDYSYCMKDKKWYYFTNEAYMVYRDQLKRESFPRPRESKETQVLASRIKRYDVGNTYQLKLPTIDEVLNLIYDISDETKRRHLTTRPIWDFGEGLPAVNARHLRDMMGLFADTGVVVMCGTERDPIYFYALKQEGLLYPVRKF